MGQSFRALIRRQGKRKVYDPHSKLMEHASLGWADVVGAVVSDIHHLPSHVVWRGEWSPSLPFFDEAWGADVITESYERTDVSENPRYIVNHSKHLYIDMKAYIAEALKLAEYGEIWEVIHPLPILTAVGNGDNGGDYHGNHQELVGTWADDVISSEDEIPEGCSAFGTIFFARI